MFRRIAIVLLAALLIGCGQVAGPASRAGQPTAAAASGGEVTPQFAFSEAVVGRNRMAIATYYGQGLPAGFYIAYPTFDKAGNWGVEIETRLSGQPQPSTSRLRLEVKQKSDTPNVGQPAIAVKTPTVKDTPDLSHLSSGTEIDPAMYQISLDDALKSGKPTALLFATPGFCQTATCGPSLQVMQGLQKTYGDKMNFIHVEVYKYPFGESAQRQDTSGLSEPMVAWHLQSEPWLFLIDAQGTIAARFEGGITKEELGPALEKLIAGQAVVVGS